MGTHEMQEGVYRCPNGCGFDELEIGTEYESFSALLGIPYQRVRCPVCGFIADPKPGRDAAIAEWNRAVLAASLIVERPGALIRLLRWVMPGLFGRAAQ